jgi:hypothetical protein
MGRSTVLGGVAGLLVAVLLMGILAVSNGVSQDLYAPLLVMGLPIVVIGMFAGAVANPGAIRAMPRSVVRAVAAVLGLVVLAAALRLMGVI